MRFNNYLIEGKKVKVVKKKDDGTLMKGKVSVGIGDFVSFDPKSKPVKGKNKFGIEGGEIEKIKGDMVYIQGYEEGAFWMNIADVWYDV